MAQKSRMRNPHLKPEPTSEGDTSHYERNKIYTHDPAKMSSLARLTQASRNHHKGGLETNKNRKKAFTGFVKFGRKMDYPKITPENITYTQIKAYVDDLVFREFAPQTIHNYITALRCAMRGTGRDLKNHFTGKALGIPPTIRKGDGVAVDEMIYNEALKNASPVVNALMRLQYHIGLRIGEAIACNENLVSWKDSLDEGATEILISHNTKGNLIRAVHVPAKDREAIYSAIVAGLAVTNSGKVHFFKNCNMHSTAVASYSRELRKVGIEKENCSHSLRRSFAVRLFEHYTDAKYTKKIALGLISLCLGHSSKRGQFVWNYYISPTLKMRADKMGEGE